ncbi:hypothetical protein [Paractinoplanes toevensis]|uniref:Integral membrane protein n=1 Tax=Paractinoplanes toevensis TaxID=571911 RepID=A0A919W7V3_9ACTN|nr:hypothetical protein [Actinoplanes toevensis]GIM90561.1 hypothetical protein Ato02nite_023540 [Actinoplanes toevensis]
MGLVLLGLDPLTSATGFGAGHVVVAASALVHVATLLICVRKGKYSTAVLGVFLPPVAWIGAVRLARPGSKWSRNRYDAAEEARARARADGLDARFGRWGLTIADLVAGRPSAPNPPANEAPNPPASEAPNPPADEASAAVGGSEASAPSGGEQPAHVLRGEELGR